MPRRSITITSVITDLVVELVSRTFVKIINPGESALVLEKGHVTRPPARFNRPGQDALYLSPDEPSARVAIGQYVTSDSRDRELITLKVSACKLLDLRDEDHSELYELARQPWIAPLKNGLEPASWIAADLIRPSGYHGLIDPSRRRPGLWHITLFEWNAPGAPSVTHAERVKAIRLDLGFK
ncbi:RES family NAD+ phosphorylase [Labrenzia sp. R4_1]|uniref:RES family NAD+ phosphorylase n=1 Tax=Labrenzia sp. R4_1 TaxID=2821106 RepID=UPI001ADC9332|nr:RES family NAD+ phosphorylase [Labrenzia sp. R4_1]MBO9424387.1 RES family NAD+ phosphorylase [Labrenzia sp. R4_1]